MAAVAEEGTAIERGYRGGAIVMLERAGVDVAAAETNWQVEAQDIAVDLTT